MRYIVSSYFVEHPKLGDNHKKELVLRSLDNVRDRKMTNDTGPFWPNSHHNIQLYHLDHPHNVFSGFVFRFVLKNVCESAQPERPFHTHPYVAAILLISK